jgi:hypothetical protein
MTPSGEATATSAIRNKIWVFPVTSLKSETNSLLMRLSALVPMRLIMGGYSKVK